MGPVCEYIFEKGTVRLGSPRQNMENPIFYGLASIVMSYGYVYVAQIAMGADYNQCVKAIAEAEAYEGPSLFIAYAPCSL